MEKEKIKLYKSVMSAVRNKMEKTYQDKIMIIEIKTIRQIKNI